MSWFSRSWKAPAKPNGDGFLIGSEANGGEARDDVKHSLRARDFRRFLLAEDDGRWVPI